jgi:hypothetical protein
MSILQGLIDAGQAGCESTGPSFSTLSPELGSASTRKAVHGADPRFATLLGTILAHATGGETACVSFVACGPHARATRVALGTAMAASGRGRALLLDARLSPGNAQGPSGPAATPLPDAFTPRLFHHRLTEGCGGLALLFGASRRQALAALCAPFGFVAIDAPSPADAPAASALAPLCLGAVLVVRAGISTEASIRDAALRLQDAGARVLGAVLDQAPANLPVWAGGT